MEKLYAIRVAPHWVHIRKSKSAPKFKESVRYVMAQERFIKTVRTRRRDEWGLPIYEDREVVKQVKHPLRNFSYIGGETICVLSIEEYNKLARRARTSQVSSTNPVVELSPSLAEKFNDKGWRLEHLQTSIEV